MPGEPTGLAYVVGKNGEVVITHGGRPATTLRGTAAARFLDDVAADDAQDLMARVTGSYRRGNERQRRQHPRNR